MSRSVVDIELKSPRLRYRILCPDDLDSFHTLVSDAHVKRFLLDGNDMDRVWSEAEIARSRALFAEAGVGLWMAEFEGRDVGFVGFRVFEEIEPEPQLLYAFLESVTGRGLATEAARALLEFAARLGWQRVLSAVDQPNRASIRVLERVGFARRGEVPGEFGPIVLFEKALASVSLGSAASTRGADGSQ